VVVLLAFGFPVNAGNFVGWVEAGLSCSVRVREVVIVALRKRDKARVDGNRATS
jgi:hypothetical protein